MVDVKTTSETFDSIAYKLDGGAPVYFNRFGDGDIFIMQDKNDRQQVANTALKEQLTKAFIDHGEFYMKGLAVDYKKEEGMEPGLFAPHHTNDSLRNFVEQIKTETTTWYNAVVFHYYSVFKQDEMIEFLNQYIRPRRKMFIGSIPEVDAERLFGPIAYYIAAPKNNAFDNYSLIKNIVMSYADDVELVIPAIGMSSRLVVYELWQRYIDREDTPDAIDFGSIVDAAAGIQSRTWIKMAPQFKKILKET